MKRKILTLKICSLFIVVTLSVISSSIAANKTSTEDTKQGAEEQTVPNIKQLVGKIENIIGPAIIVSGKELRVTPDTYFLDSDKNNIGSSKFKVGEQVLIVFHPLSLQLLQMIKMGGDVTTDETNQPKKIIPKPTERINHKETEEKDMNQNKVKLENGVYVN